MSAEARATAEGKERMRGKSNSRDKRVSAETAEYGKHPSDDRER
ncbi:MAG: hypothetical protein ACLRVN_05345 [Butyricicoccus sp.]